MSERHNQKTWDLKESGCRSDLILKIGFGSDRARPSVTIQGLGSGRRRWPAGRGKQHTGHPRRWSRAPEQRVHSVESGGYLPDIGGHHVRELKLERRSEAGDGARKPSSGPQWSNCQPTSPPPPPRGRGRGGGAASTVKSVGGSGGVAAERRRQRHGGGGDARRRRAAAAARCWPRRRPNGKRR
jgi:hypothetical protein